MTTEPLMIPEGEYKAELIAYNPNHMVETYKLCEGPFMGRHVFVSVVGRPLTMLRITYKTVGERQMLTPFAEVIP